MTDSPRAYTSDELRDKFLHEVRTIAAYWAGLPDHDRATGKAMTVRDRCDGVAFSILALLDGTTLDIPGIDLVFQPDEEDKEYYIQNGENWIEPGTVVSTTLRHHFSSPTQQTADETQG
ncbi:hypothetical protein D3C71_156740 [compost metagenome]